jgi:HlyD family secretion protein
MNRNIRLAIATVGVAVVLIWLFAGWLSPGRAVDAVRAKTGGIAESVDERAITRLPETFVIATPSAGRVETIVLEEGTPVKAGQVVARFVPIDLSLAVREAEAAIDRLKASIHESGDTSVEETGRKQADQYVLSTKATVAASKARLEASAARLKYSRDDLRRVRDLVGTRARTEDDLDRAVLDEVQSRVTYQQDEFIYAAMLSIQAATDLLPTMVSQYIARKGLSKAVLEKQLVEAQVRLEQVKLSQERGTMRSPVDGVVLQRYVRDEGFFPPGTRLLEIGQLERMEVEADLLTVDVVGVKRNGPVEIYGPAIGVPPARGTVERIYPSGFSKVSSLGVEQQRVKTIVRFEPNDLKRLLAERNLGVGYRVRVRIETARKSDALVVPRSALFRGPGGRWQLYAIRDGRAHVQDVTVGLVNDEDAEITSGLAQGDLVIPSPESNLRHGQRVAPAIREEPVARETQSPGNGRGSGE